MAKDASETSKTVSTGVKLPIRILSQSNAGVSIADPFLFRAIPTFHPSSLIKGGWMWRGTVVQDLARAKAWQSGALWIGGVLYDPEWDGISPTPGTLDPVAVDLETIRETDIITQVNLSWQAGSAVAGVWKNENVAAQTKLVLAQNRSKIFHNAQFDLDVLYNNDITVNGDIHDTMIMAAILEPDLPNNLEHVAKDYTDIQPWKHLAAEQPGIYGCKDADATFRIWLAGMKELTNEGVLGVYSTSMQVLPLVISMHRKGLRVDEGAAKKATDACLQEEEDATLDLDYMVSKAERRKSRVEAIEGQLRIIEAALENPKQTKKTLIQLKAIRRTLDGQLKEQVHPNWASPQQVIAALEDIGVTVKPDPKTGKKSVDAATIQELARQTKNPALIRLLDLRRAKKLRTTYFEQPLSATGRIHPQYLLHRDYDIEGDPEGACSGRLASKGPNIQNWPKEARSIVVPDVDGWEFLEADYSQIEFRIIAWATGGRLWADVNTDGFDIHRRVAAAVYGCPVHEVSKEQRDEGKRCVYAGAYGVGPLTLSRRLASKGVFMSVAEAKKFISAFKDMYPEVGTTQKRWVEEAMATNRVRNPFGRYRRFYKPTDEATEIYNYFPQSTAGDIILRAMARLRYSLLGPARVAIQVHDSLVFTYPAEMRDEVVRCAKAAMTMDNPEMPGFKVAVEMKVGQSWGSMVGIPV